MTKDKTTETAPAGATVHLDSPIIRAGGDITAINLRKPTAGELRGLSLVELSMMNTDALQKLLPRITNPALTEAEIQKMNSSDFVQIASEVAGFLVPASRKEPQQ
jgi:hypothetical protein